MQAAGGLKKKKKRNLAKVTASGVVLYDPASDNFDPYSVNGRNHSASSISAWREELEGYRQGRNPRATRDPNFSSTRVTRIAATFIDFEEEWSPDQRPTSDRGTLNQNHDRPVLLSDNHIARLRNIIWLGIASFSFPWRYNTKTHRVDLFTPFLTKLWRLIWYMSVVQSAGIAVFQVHSFYSRMGGTDETGSWRPVFMSSFSVLWYCYSLSLSATMFWYGEAMRNYVNAMLEINGKLVDAYLITAEGHKEGGQILLNLSIPTNITQTFISISLFLTFPNSPWYLYNYVYSPDHGWWWLIPGALHEFVFAGQVLCLYLLIAWIVVAHANSVTFWLQEAHKLNDSEMTRTNLRQPNNAIRVYRSLQVLTNLFNDAMAPMAIPVVKVISWTALIPCGFVLTRSMSGGKFVRELPGILTYPLAVIDCASCPFGLLQMGARMYDITASFLTSWSQTRHFALRKILISCPLLKAKIGGLYYITTSTTIQFFKSALDYIINAIVSFP